MTASNSASHNKHGWWVETGLPFVSSLTFHASLLGVGYLTYQSIKVLLQPTRIEQTSIPDASLVATSNPLDLSNEFRGPDNLPDRPPIQDVQEDNAAKGWNTERSSNAQGISGPGDSSTNEDSTLGSIIGPGPAGRGPGVDGDGGSGGPLAPFGHAQRGGSPNIFYCGPSRDRARSIVFLCDSSGSMLPKFADLRRELNKAVQTLAPSQSFGITFFGDGKTYNLSPALLMANPENKLHADNFMENVTPRSTTDPLPGLEMAFKEKPELVYLLTDGDFPDNDAVLARIRQLNKDHRVKINTIAFVGETDTDTAFMALLKQIAQENGGIYRHVKQDELR